MTHKKERINLDMEGSCDTCGWPIDAGDTAYVNAFDPWDTRIYCNGECMKAACHPSVVGGSSGR